ncbi:hypothetical protein KDL01_19245 [Actinospica durhamensis]|uniref:Uncharacterized protein n=1 Tax=Actinospica durhamensis TaxID=1508375 RepID=A0A941EUS0_9ACTN|nr:hypothetical protein [Actinospica durhamensis]MBR7835419.1 hypothetical protein [Actinospica durhamensis]
MSELDALLAEAVPVMSGAVAAYGTGVLSRLEDASADAAVGLGRRMLQSVWRHAGRPEAVEEAVADLAAAPEDPDALAALRLQVRKVLSADGELLRELSAQLAASSAGTVAAGAGAVAIGGHNHGVVGTGAGSALSLGGVAIVVNPTLPGPGGS